MGFGSKQYPCMRLSGLEVLALKRSILACLTYQGHRRSQHRNQSRLDLCLCLPQYGRLVNRRACSHADNQHSLLSVEREYHCTIGIHSVFCYKLNIQRPTKVTGCTALDVDPVHNALKTSAEAEERPLMSCCFHVDHVDADGIDGLTISHLKTHTEAHVGDRAGLLLAAPLPHFPCLSVHIGGLVRESRASSCNDRFAHRLPRN